MKKTKTIQINEPEMAEEKVMKIDLDKRNRYSYNLGPSSAITADISEVKNEVSKLISSVKQLQRQERIDKRRRWKNAVKCGKHFH